MEEIDGSSPRQEPESDAVERVPTYRVGRDGFHSVPLFSRWHVGRQEPESDAVERVPTGRQGSSSVSVVWVCIPNRKWEIGKLHPPPGYLRVI
jgi:hypothetical protein